MNVTLFAWKHGYPLVEKTGIRNGYAVFEPKRRPEGVAKAPTVILVNEAEVRLAHGDEIVARPNGALA